MGLVADQVLFLMVHQFIDVIGNQKMTLIARHIDD
jgi:hypothetical protein